MPIPDYQTIMLPLLVLLADRAEHKKQEAVDTLAKYFKLTDAELLELLPSCLQPIFGNRVGWAMTYLKKAGLIEAPRRAVCKITERGIETLKQSPKEINVKFLSQFPEFLEFKGFSRKDTSNRVEEDVELKEGRTPQELLEYGYEKIRQDLSDEILKRVKECSANFFEKLVVALLISMGYGGSRSDLGRAVGRSGDEGIDGVIKQDQLGLDVIYIQAKKWDNPVSRPEIQKFVGALEGQKANKGVFITTSTYTNEAKEFASKVSSKVILIDGKELVRLLIDHDIGVSTTDTYKIKRIDSDYFAEE